VEALKSTIVEAVISIVGALLTLMLNAIKTYAAYPDKLKELKSKPENLLDLLPGQFDFWLIALTLIVSAHYSIQKGRAKLNQALIVLVIFLVILVFFSFMDGAFKFRPLLSIGIPNVIGVALIFVAIHSIVLAKKV
jgi:hypothetical protein